MPRQFRAAQIDAARIGEQVKAAPATIYRAGGIGLNVFPLVPGRIVDTDIAVIRKVSGPAWIAVTPDQAQALIAERPNTLRVVLQFGQDDEWRLLRLEK
jgi:hypothetical protein